MTTEITECWDCSRAGRVTPAVENDPNDLCADCNAARDAEDARDRAAMLDRLEGQYRMFGWQL